MPTPKKRVGKKPAAKRTVAKKRKPKKPTPRDLNKSEAFYIESHFGQKDAEQMAADTGAPVESIERYLKLLADTGFQAKAPVTSVQEAGFAVHNVVVSMTKRAAEVGDEFRGVTADGMKKERPVNQLFLNKRVPSIHVIDPSRPVRW